ncbi:iron-siderophore ABC transporter substrate-binding protein [Rhizobiaceae bacterium n13]|uniref:Iron-siderophore ABC transporter substrate-binding protein n=1 Tax=Ferirhizobium litorale TaxID=2927786 RepID=A0AAE3QFD8_9HYPH|nr:iron-siderophore ABC transporter substrate-binding protein [Fererhizobium litorale]MDI7861575.1 iron-siderophore ABC transporter substrate-binding protein [Fererhizobium litorale]MDI7922083.1 iron-siderophore ABC transporter substrate-binding protein [Fererhizobium litorale]
MEFDRPFEASRRQFLGLLAALTVPAPTKAADAPRVAAIDWAMLETAMALGVVPIAATELIGFRDKAVEPAIPPSVADLGLRGAPNYEYLYLLKPDLILSSPFYARQQQKLESIAPVFSLPFYVRGEPPFEKALNAVSALGGKLGRERRAEEVLSGQAAEMARMRQQLAAVQSPPVYIINVGDARHFRAFGPDSMFGDVAGRLGLENAWADRSRFTFAAPVPLEALASRPDATIVIVSDIPVEARESLHGSMIWRSLAPVRDGRVHMIGNVNPYGGICAAMRFARLLTEALTGSESTP